MLAEGATPSCPARSGWGRRRWRPPCATADVAGWAAGRLSAPSGRTPCARGCGRAFILPLALGAQEEFRAQLEWKGPLEEGGPWRSLAPLPFSGSTGPFPRPEGRQQKRPGMGSWSWGKPWSPGPVSFRAGFLAPIRRVAVASSPSCSSARLLALPRSLNAGEYLWAHCSRRLAFFSAALGRFLRAEFEATDDYNITMVRLVPVRS